jgi:bacteriocin biosynthesis cyclodehydratase domain-containing protein
MRAVLKPLHRPVARGCGALQLGTFPDAAVLPDDDGVRALLEALDGRRPLAEIVERLVHDGTLSRAKARHIIDLLTRADALDDAATPLGALRTMPAAERQRLHHDLRAWNLSRPGPSSGMAALHRRRAVWVEVDGNGRTALGIAAALAAASVGHVSLRDHDGRVVTHADLGPLGPHAHDIGLHSLDAATAMVRRAGTTTLGDPTTDAGEPDLAVVVGEPSSPRADAWLRRDVPHLLVHATRGHGLVGPLVVPGRTACGRCLEQHRADADPARAVVTWRCADAIDDVDTTVSTAMAALVVAQATAFLEHRSPVGSVDGLLRLDAIHGTTTRTPVPPHRRCGCTWPAPPRRPGRTMGP